MSMSQKKGAVIVNGYFSNASTVHQQESLKAEFAALGVRLDIIKGNSLPCMIENGEVHVNIPHYDFIIFLDKDLYTAYLLEKAGYKLFNSAKAIELCDDKMRTYIALSGGGINMPKTVSSPIMYRPEFRDEHFLEMIIQQFDFPIIVKKVHGSMGNAVFKADNIEQLSAFFEQLKLFPHIYQQYLGDGTGRDLRVIVVGGKAVCAMNRVNPYDFRSNIELGGVGEKTVLTDAQRAIAENSAKILELDYAGVDILSHNGVLYLCEINSNAFFKGICETTGVSVAKIYANYIFGKIY